ncbi:uncharacterized protein BHQ10_010164 [Talaromyces amestolkiae]|uniref:Uncharacterized protein n=1 Tax=Talaromyces amestolkiae TaxID=1196081 RepID=A0A364LEE0_TALAM|nr:uncharacterized protein BHQ10_010164 [Talaromyces amestolkiae]RAO74152.1 hypothetical protein BHQ10_010164 [Talaromyces amestolkiae]
MKPLYILVRNQDYEYRPNESTGWLNIGSILTKPTEPESLLEGYSITTPHDDVPIKSTWKVDFRSEDEKRKSRGYGISADLFKTLPVPIELNATRSNESTTVNEIGAKRLETYIMTPTTAYLDQVLSTPPVQEYLRKHKYFTSLYIVTGIRVARHGSGSKANSHSSKIQLGASIDAGGISGAPGILDVGPNFGRTKEIKRREEWTTCSDYIYAYRVAKIKQSLRGNGPKLTHHKGELYSLDLDFEEQNWSDEHIDRGVYVEDEEWAKADALPIDKDDDGDEPCNMMFM